MKSLLLVVGLLLSLTAVPNAAAVEHRFVCTNVGPVCGTVCTIARTSTEDWGSPSPGQGEIPVGPIPTDPTLRTATYAYLCAS